MDPSGRGKTDVFSVHAITRTARIAQIPKVGIPRRHGVLGVWQHAPLETFLNADAANAI